MLIVHVTETFVPEIGYQEVHLARAQARAGHRVVVLSSREKPAGAMECGSAAQESTVEVRRLPSRRIGNRLWLRGLERHLAELKPDWVIAHNLMTFGTIRAAFARLRGRFGGVLTIDDHTVLSNRRGGVIGSAAYRAFRTFMAPWLVRTCHDFVAVTPETLDLLSSDFGIPGQFARLVPLGADADLFRPDQAARAAVRRRLEWPPDAIVLVYAGKFLPEKCVPQLIDAVEPLVAADPKLKLLLIGSGPAGYERELHRRAGVLPAGSVHFHPPVPNGELPALLSAADIGIWPGSESIVHLEAMACGLAIIIRDKRSLRDRVEGGAGLLTTGDPADIRIKLAELLTNAGLRESIRKQARAKIEAQLSWTCLARRFEPEWKGPRPACCAGVHQLARQ